MAPLNSEYYASNDETKGDSIGSRESFSSRYEDVLKIVFQREMYFSLETTPSDIDDVVAGKLRFMTEHALLQKYLLYLNEMNDDLVFSGSCDQL